MRPFLRVHRAARLALESIVPDRRGRAERLVEVPLFEKIALSRRMAPDAGEAVSLELEPHRRAAGSFFGPASLVQAIAPYGQKALAMADRASMPTPLMQSGSHRMSPLMQSGSHRMSPVMQAVITTTAAKNSNAVRIASPQIKLEPHCGFVAENCPASDNTTSTAISSQL